jgi:hypothetical protein
VTTRTFKDIEHSLLDWLKGRFDELADNTLVDEHVGNEVPTAMMGRLPFVVVERIGGPDDFFNDYPTVGIDVFARTRTQAYDLAEGIRAAILAPALVAGGTLLDSVVTRSAPAKAPWEGDDVYRRRAVYDISTRR